MTLRPLALALGLSAPLLAAAAERVVDVPTRPGVTVRLLLVDPDGPPRAAVVLLAGGHGGLRIGPDGRIEWGKRNFLVRARARFAAEGLLAAVVDAPSDRLHDPFLQGFRDRRDHATDLGAVIQWLRREAKVPVWLVGTSRGTVSAAFAAVAHAGTPESPDGIVLTSTILDDRHDVAVPDLDLGRLRVPVLLVHHAEDECRVCPPAFLPHVERKLGATRHETVLVSGGTTEGDRCEAVAHHGFNGNEADVVAAVARFVLAPAGR